MIGNIITSVGTSSGGGGGGGVTELNGLTGAVTLSAGSGIVISGSGSDIAVHASGMLRKAAATFSSSTTWTMVHNWGTSDVLVQVYDNSSLAMIPDDINVSNVNQIVVTFLSNQAGRMVAIG